jgi:hypothetical protein
VNQAYGIGGNHGFSFQVPDQYLHDGKAHSLIAYGINIDPNSDLPGGGNPALGGSPKSLQGGPGEQQIQLSAGGAGCVDGMCVWVNGTGFNADVGVDIRDKAWNLLDSYRGADVTRLLNQNPQNVAVRLRSAQQKQLFVSQGLIVSVLNPGGTWNTIEVKGPSGLPKPTQPIGVLDGVSATGVAGGWTYSPYDPNQSLQVHFYLDGNFIGATWANISRPDVNQAFGIGGNHGYSFQVPDQYLHDGKMHSLIAYGINIDPNGDLPGGGNPVLGGSPKTISSVGQVLSMTKAASGPAVAMWSNRIDLFARGTNNHLIRSSWTGIGLVSQDWGGNVISDPATVSWGPDRLDVFAVAPDHSVVHAYGSATGLAGWDNRGGVVSEVSAVSWGPNRIDLFARGLGDRQLYHMAWDGSHWSEWQPLGGLLIQPVTAVSWGPNRLDVFGIGGDSVVYHMAWDGRAWSGWQRLPGATVVGITVESWGLGRLDLFARGTDNGFYHFWYDDSVHMSAWEHQDGGLLGTPTAVSWAPNRIDVFAIGGGNSLYHKFWDGQNWSPWQPLGGWLNAANIQTVSWAPGRLDLFGLGSDQQVWHMAWDGTGWSPFGVFAPAVSGL